MLRALISERPRVSGPENEAPNPNPGLCNRTKFQRNIMVFILCLVKTYKLSYNPYYLNRQISSDR